MCQEVNALELLVMVASNNRPQITNVSTEFYGDSDAEIMWGFLPNQKGVWSDRYQETMGFLRDQIFHPDRRVFALVQDVKYPHLDPASTDGELAGLNYIIDRLRAEHLQRGGGLRPWQHTLLQTVHARPQDPNQAMFAAARGQHVPRANIFPPLNMHKEGPKQLVKRARELAGRRTGKNCQISGRYEFDGLIDWSANHQPFLRTQVQVLQSQPFPAADENPCWWRLIHVTSDEHTDEVIE